MPVDCSIIFPVHNERETIRRNLADIAEALRRELRGRTFEIVVVDNGSADGTETVVTELARTVPELVFHRIETKGRGAALRLGFSRARGRYLGVLAVDRAWDESFIGKAAALLDAGTDVVYGQKSHPHSTVSRPLHRMLASRLLQRWLAWRFGISRQDTQCIKLFRAAAVPFLTELGDYNYFAETEFFLRASQCRLKTASLPVEVIDRRPDSKVRLTSLVEFLHEASHFARRRTP